MTITWSIHLLETISPREYHPSSYQCFDIAMVYYYRNLQFLRHIIIIKSKILLPQAYMTYDLS